MTERQIPMPSSQRFLGILTRKERWGLSWRGWLAVVLVAMLAGWGCLVSVYPFLAVTHRVDAEVLVVEGWVHDCAIFPATEEFKTGRYLHIFTTGGPVEGDGRYTNDPNTSASAGADRLKKIGVPNDSLQMVPSRVMSRDRTYSSAVALRDWLHEHQISVRSINIVTEDVSCATSSCRMQARPRTCSSRWKRCAASAAAAWPR